MPNKQLSSHNLNGTWKGVQIIFDYLLYAGEFAISVFDIDINLT